jgi:RimJ/RimL family protein N-acetyltransferase
MIEQIDAATVQLVEGDLVLRPWSPADADAVYRACQDEQIQRWTTVPVPYEPRHAETFVTRIAPGQWAAGTAAALGVFDRADGTLLGANGLVLIQPDTRTAEVGAWTAPWARGRGVATAATRATCRWAFDTLGLHRLLWWAEVGNTPSRRAAERAGFRFGPPLPAAMVDRDGSYRDAWRGLLLSPHARYRPSDGQVVAAAPAARSRSDDPKEHA